MDLKDPSNVMYLHSFLFTGVVCSGGYYYSNIAQECICEFKIIAERVSVRQLLRVVYAYVRTYVVN